MSTQTVSQLNTLAAAAEDRRSLPGPRALVLRIFR